jgi:hypothetical protein
MMSKTPAGAVLALWLGVALVGCADPEFVLDRLPDVGDVRLPPEEWPAAPDAPWVFPSPAAARMCVPNNDGIIAADEMPVVIGAVVAHRLNRPGQAVAVDPVGAPTARGWEWDFAARSDDEVTAWLEVHPVAGAWFAAHFPGATNAAPVSPFDPGTLGVYRVGDGAVALLGLASRSAEPAGRTLLVYDEPLVMFRFPLALGQTWAQTVTFRDALLMGVKNAGSEEYLFAVDGRGALHLPDFSLENALRVRMRVRQRFVVGQGAPAVEHVYYLWLSECLGEVARVVSLPGETALDFDTAREYRRMGL